MRHEETYETASCCSIVNSELVLVCVYFTSRDIPTTTLRRIFPKK